MKLQTVWFEFVDSNGLKHLREATLAGTDAEMYEQAIEFIVEIFKTEGLMISDIFWR